MKIHHYTNLQTLALILKYGTLRFNRLDRVDDITEAKAYGPYDISKYLFVSCWTDSEAESIPQWHMYTNEMTGVRISFPIEIFHYQPLRAPAEWNMTSAGEILSPILFERLFTDKYIVLPNIIDKKQFERKVQYIDDIRPIFENAVSVKIEPSGEATATISKVGDFAGYKNKAWEFQSEFRFVMFILPSLPLPPAGFSDPEYIDKIPSHILNCLVKGIGPEIDYFDIQINPEVIDNIEITLGPLSTAADEILVEALLQEYTKNGTVSKSALSGTIRRPMR
ncbi:MAG: hypothetical protein PHH91_11850 [Desulfuromonadaceae bacterium]|nr:hypothetical protein [Desulfuromonadaceae bacterium]